MKKMIAFEMDEMDGQPVYVEAEVSEMEMQRVSRGGESEPVQAELRFVDAIAKIKRVRPEYNVLFRNVLYGAYF